MTLFNFKRFALLYRNEILSSYRKWIIFLATIIGIYTLTAIIYGTADKYGLVHFNSNLINNFFTLFLFIVGYISTSFVFSDINNKLKNSLWFSLPGTTLEKFLVGMLGSSFGFVLFFIMAFILASLISAVITVPLFDLRCDVFNPFRLTVGSREIKVSILWISLIYILTQSVFLVGSITFKSAAFIKTTLVAVGILIIYLIIMSIVISLFSTYGTLGNMDIRIITNILGKPQIELRTLLLRILVISNSCVFIFFNIVGYLKLKEKEVKGGI